MSEKQTKILDRLLTIKDVAELCRVSTRTVRRWIDDGTLTAAKLGAQWRIRPRDLEHFILDRLEQ
jgi:excisionase family DNA binding protein